jgi:hypothetical protein
MAETADTTESKEQAAVPETKVTATKKPEMSMALAKAITTATLPLHEAVNLLYTSSLIKPGQSKTSVLAILTLGRELGLSDISSLTGLSISPQGTVIVSAQTLQLLVKKSGKYKFRVKKRDATGSEIEVFEKVDGAWESCGVPVSFSARDAETAGLSKKDTYIKYKTDMLFARTVSATFRTYCSDALAGSPMYLPEEIDDSGYKSGENGELIADADYEVKAKSSTPQTKSPSAIPQSKSSPTSQLDTVKSLLASTKSSMAAFKPLYGTDDVTKLNADQLTNLQQTLEKKVRAT